MKRQPPRSKSSDTLCPDTTLFRSNAVLAQALDDDIREHLFQEPFEPFEDEHWRLLLLQPVIDHVVKVFGLALVKSEERDTVGETEVRHRRLSEGGRNPVREGAAMEVTRHLYPRTGWPPRSDGLERPVMEW